MRTFGFAAAVVDRGKTFPVPLVPPITDFDDLVASFGEDVVSFWSFAADGTDAKGTQDAAITGTPEVGLDAITQLNEGGACIAWSGATGEYAEAAHNAAHKTAEGTIIVYHQHDKLDEKATLVSCDQSGTGAGGLSIEVNQNGSPRAFMRDATDAAVELLGGAGDVELGRAYCTIFKWGSAGISLALWDDAGTLVVRDTDPSVTNGLTGTSPIRFGAWHTDVSHHDGPFGPVVWLSRRLSDEEEETFAIARTIEHEAEPPQFDADAPFFGLAFGDDTVNGNASNSRITASDTAGHSDFFWAERSGVVTHFRHQWRSAGQDAGYSDGDGGIYTIEIRKADPDTKRPFTTASALVCQVTGITANVNTSAWPTYEFTIKGSLVKGDPYCLVYRNTHPDPTNNYVSENRSLQYGDAPGDGSTPPSGGWTPIVVPSSYAGAGRPHKPYPTWTRFPPSLTTKRIGMGHWNIRYADGQWVGCGGPAQIASPPGAHTIQGNNMVRHRFRPWRNHIVTGVSVCVQRRNASSGNLVITLESGPSSLSSGNGLPIETVTIPASALFDIGSRSEYDHNNHKVWWNTVNFSQPHTLNAGTIYTIRLSASGGLDARINASYRGEHSNIQWSPVHDDFDTHEANQQLSWSSWEYSLGLQVSTNSGSSWSFPTGNNRQTCPILVLCQPPS